MRMPRFDVIWESVIRLTLHMDFACLVVLAACHHQRGQVERFEGHPEDVTCARAGNEHAFRCGRHDPELPRLPFAVVAPAGTVVKQADAGAVPGQPEALASACVRALHDATLGHANMRALAPFRYRNDAGGCAHVVEALECAFEVPIDTEQLCRAGDRKHLAALEADRRDPASAAAWRVATVRGCFDSIGAQDPELGTKVNLVLAVRRLSDCYPLEAARHAEMALSIAGAEEIAIAALEVALVSGQCDSNTIDAVIETSARLRASSHHARTLDSRAARLETMTRKACNELVHHDPARRRHE